MSVGFRYLGDAAPRGGTDDGFSTVGDLGYLDADGYLHLVDRRVDMIVSGGANVYPAEVETALVDHPAIADIVVIGLRDPEWGRRVHAIVEPADRAAPPTDGDVIAYAKSPPGAVQGAEDGRDRRRHPPQRGHQGQPPGPRRGPRRLTGLGYAVTHRGAQRLSAILTSSSLSAARLPSGRSSVSSSPIRTS